MKRIIFITFIVCCFSAGPIHSEKHASINVNLSNYSYHKISASLFGGFVEFLHEYINGPFGMWAQEFQDRGFDNVLTAYREKSYNWKIKTDNPDSSDFELIDGGYNPNGYLFQRIHAQNNTAGIYQTIFYDDTTRLNLYIYARSENLKGNLFFKIYDNNFKNLLYTEIFEDINDNWQKYEFTSPVFSGYTQLQVLVGITGNGYIDLDESSCMPDNNVGGVRREYYDLYKFWQPGLLRYPGGCFSDTPQNNWLLSTGAIDNRLSPNRTWDLFLQRMDFGLDEYLAFCESLAIEPYITVNYQNGSPEEASQLVEYLNGSTETEFGAMRAINGHPEPYAVKYFEIGNEQWTDPLGYGSDYNYFYDAMKKVDSSIILLLASTHWAAKEDYFDKLIGITGNKSEVYGWHPMVGGYYDKPADDEDRYVNFVGHPIVYQQTIEDINSWLADESLKNYCTQAVTEWWSTYGTAEDWIVDTNYRNHTLESAIWNAGFLHLVMSNSNNILLGARTSFLGMIEAATDTIKGKRIIYGTPSFYAMSLLRNHFGTTRYIHELECEYFSFRDNLERWPFPDQPWLDVLVSGTEDSLFISVINKHPNEDFRTSIFLSDTNSNKMSKIYEISSDYFLDMNTPEEANKINIKQYEEKFTNEHIFPPHSISVIAIPNDTISPAGIKEVKILPAPFKEYFEIFFPEPFLSSTEINIYNYLGKEVYSKIIPAGTEFISISDFNPSPGIYFIKIYSENNNFAKKIIKI